MGNTQAWGQTQYFFSIILHFLHFSPWHTQVLAMTSWRTQELSMASWRTQALAMTGILHPQCNIVAYTSTSDDRDCTPTM